MVRQDPAISSRRLFLEMHPWWGPKGLGDAYFAEKRNKPSSPDRMIAYQLALLFAGRSRKADHDPETRKIQEAHMAGIRSMAAAGTLIAAGPFTDDGKLRGVFVFRLASLDEAKALTAQDAAVKARRLVMDIHPVAGGRRCLSGVEVGR